MVHNTLSTMAYIQWAPAGTATITATGRTSGKIGTATVTVGVLPQVELQY